MSVYLLCERALALINASGMPDLSPDARELLENLDVEGLVNLRAQKEAVVCARHFAPLRDKLLSLYPWVFARKTASPAEIAGAVRESPLPGWRHAYALPSDCLKLLGVQGGRPPIRPEPHALSLVHYEQAGKIFGCNHRHITIRYTARVTDTDQWPAAFSDAFCSMLAGEAAASAIAEPRFIQAMDARAQASIAEARREREISPLTTEFPLQQPLFMDYSGVPSCYEL